MKKTVYVAGRMTNVPYFNFPAFDKARDDLIELGYNVISPADMDREHGFDAMELPDDSDWSKWGKALGEFDIDACIDRDIDAIKRSQAIYLLDGWEQSTGARAEKSIAEWMGKELLYETPTKEKRIVNEKTGGEKCRKPARFELLPHAELWEVAELYGKGAEKYDDHNWTKGYDWSLSYGAMQRHANLFWQGEYMDEENQAPHLASVVFHAFALMYFFKHHKELDDRKISS